MLIWLDVNSAISLAIYVTWKTIVISLEMSIFKIHAANSLFFYG